MDYTKDKRFLIVSNMYPNKKYPSYGIFVKNFCIQLGEMGIKYDVSAMTKSSHKLGKVFKYLFFYITTFFKCVFGKYDTVYIHYPSFSAKPVLIAKKIRQFDIISNVHGTDVVPLKREHEKMMGITREAINESKKVVVPSEYYKKLIVEKYAISSNLIFVYPSAGVNEKTFYEYDATKKQRLTNEYNISKDYNVIGFVSRINKAKGWDIFLEAICQVDKLQKNNSRIYIVGSGEDDEELERRIRQLPDTIRDSIKRYPLLPQEKLADIYNLLDVFIFPTISASESLGLVAIEAMACGCPVIASDYAAPKYYVEDGVNGYKFMKGNSDQLSERIKEFLNLDEEQRMVMRNNAKKTAAKYYSTNIKNILKSIVEYSGGGIRK